MKLIAAVAALALVARSVDVEAQKRGDRRGDADVETKTRDKVEVPDNGDVSLIWMHKCL